MLVRIANYVMSSFSPSSDLVAAWLFHLSAQCTGHTLRQLAQRFNTILQGGVRRQARQNTEFDAPDDQCLVSSVIIISPRLLRLFVRREQGTEHTLAGSQDKLDEFSDPRSELACDIWSRIFSFLFDFPQLICGSLAWYQCWTQALPRPARPAGKKLSLSRIRIKLINDDWPPLTGPWSHLAPAEERELL